MRKLVFALALAVLPTLAAATTAEASTTAIHASPASSVVGQSVTFTATLTSSCAGTVTSHSFYVDGNKKTGTFRQTGLTATETLSISTLSAGNHTIKYTWAVANTACRGVAFLTYTVAAAPPPSPPPSPSPSPSQSPSPSPSPVTLVASRPTDSPLLGFLGGALILVVVVAGGALMVLARR